MLFENALYYPTIDIKDEAWLKSAVLLWDTISTIVPESEDEPYKNELTRAFAQAGIVSPHKVNPYNVNFQGLGGEVRANSYGTDWSDIRSIRNGNSTISINNKSIKNSEKI